jgi:uncharacterized membrane protein
LIVWQLGAPATPDTTVTRLRRLVRESAATVDDAALVTWPHGARKPSVRCLGSLDGPGRLWGRFWGVLLYLIFPPLWPARTFGAAAGVLAGTFADLGLDGDFAKRARDGATPGTSAVFIVSTGVATDRLAAGGFRRPLVRLALSPEDDRRFRDTFGEETRSPTALTPET